MFNVQIPLIIITLTISMLTSLVAATPLTAQADGQIGRTGPTVGAKPIAPLQVKTLPQQDESDRAAPPPQEEVKPDRTNSEKIIEAVINEKLDALRKGDLSKAYYAFTSKDFQRKVSLELFRHYVEGNLTLHRNKEFVLKEISFSGPVATVRGQLISHDGKISVVKFELIADQDTWIIRRIDLHSK